MADYAAVLLLLTGQECGNVHEREYGDTETVAEANKARRLVRRVEVERTREHVGLIRHYAHRSVTHAYEAYHYVLGPVRLHFEESASVRYLLYHAANVVCLFLVVGNNGLKARRLGYAALVEGRALVFAV